MKPENLEKLVTKAKRYEVPAFLNVGDSIGTFQMRVKHLKRGYEFIYHFISPTTEWMKSYTRKELETEFVNY